MRKDDFHQYHSTISDLHEIVDDLKPSYQRTEVKVLCNLLKVALIRLMNKDIGVTYVKENK